MPWTKKKFGVGLLVLLAIPVVAVLTLPLWFPKEWVRKQLVTVLSQATGGQTEIGEFDLKVGLRTGVEMKDVALRFGGDAYPPISAGVLKGTLPLGALVRGAPVFDYSAEDLNGGSMAGTMRVELSGERPFTGSLTCDKIGVEQNLLVYLEGVLPFPTLKSCAADARMSAQLDYRGNASEDPDVLLASLTGEGWAEIDPLNLTAHPLYGENLGVLTQVVEVCRKSLGDEKAERILSLLREMQIPLGARADFTIGRERIENTFVFRAKSYEMSMRGSVTRPTGDAPAGRIRYEITADSFSDPDLREFWLTYIGEEPHVVEGTMEGVDPGIERLTQRIARNRAEIEARHVIDEHRDEARERIEEEARRRLPGIFR